MADGATSDNPWMTGNPAVIPSPKARVANDPEGTRMEGRIRMPSRHLILLKLVLTPRNQEIRSTPVRAPNGQGEHHFPGT